MKRLTAILIIALLTVTLSAQVFTPVAFDKKYHIGAGALIGVRGTITGNSLNLTPEGSAFFGMGAVTVAAFGKEVWDVSWRVVGDKNAQADPMDAAATMLGGVISVGLSYAGLKLFKKKKSEIIYSAEKDFMCVGIKLTL